MRSPRYRALRGKSLRVFPDVAIAVRARMAAGAQVGSRLEERAARLLVERGVVPVRRRLHLVAATRA